MAVPPTPNTVKVCMRYQKSGQQVCNVFHVETGEPPDETILGAIAAEFMSWWTNTFKALVHASCSLQAIEVTDVSAPGGLGIVYTTGLPQNGAASGNALPNNVTVATKLTTGFTGRSHRGRTYHPALSDTQVNADPNTLLTAVQTNIQAALVSLMSDLIVAGFQLVVNSLWSNGAQRTVGVNTPVTGASTNATIDSQRRRLPERGV